MILLIGIAIAIFVAPDGWELPVIAGFAILEVAETMFTWRWSRRGRVKVGVETLAGMTGRAVTDCRPTGTVRVRGEAWRAHCDAGVTAGQAIRVTGRDQLLLLVEPDGGASSPHP